MINPINHFALTAWPSVHDEEAMTALELQARTTAKVNECIEIINQQVDIITAELAKVPELASKALDTAIKDGAISEQLNGELMDALRANLATLQKSIDATNDRISSIVGGGTATDGNVELIDARKPASGSPYTTLGDHVRAIETGEGLSDAVRPGVVKTGRIMSGNLGGDFAHRHIMRETVPMAGRWTENGYYEPDTLNYTEHSLYYVSDPIPCAYGDSFFLSSYVFDPNVFPAVVFDAGGRALEVIGEPGKSNWDANAHTVQVSHPDAAAISFVCGTGYVTKFLAARLTVNPYPDIYAAMQGSGYLHMHAKKRTDTVTDRAQIKVWFELPEGRKADDVYSIPIQLLESYNVHGITFRLFGAVSASSYEVALPETASGYTYSPFDALRPRFTVPFETGAGEKITHVALFVDFLPVNGEEYMEAYLPPMHMEMEGVTDYVPDMIPGTGYALHGNLDTDYLNIVRAGVIGSNTHNRKVLGIGDSLMSGNTLRKSDSWFNLAAGSHDMGHHNAAANGLPVAGADSMVTRAPAALAVMPDPDYCIIQGGANDKRLNVPIEDFKNGIRAIVDAVIASSPMCKILLATNWHRTTSANSLGLYDADYVAAMLEVAEEIALPCINNYANGLDLLNPSISAWADEGIVSTGTANIHFSREANKAIATRYIRELEKL